MSLYNIIKSLQTTQGNNAKQAILEANKDNELLKQYMKAMLDPAINYYITKVPTVAPKGWQECFDLLDIQHAISTFASREVTGNDAKRCLHKWLEDQASEQDQELIKYLIERKIAGSNVGDSMVLKTWPDLYFVPPYMRCASMSDKIREYYSSLPSFFVQTKRDGSFAYLQKTSQGVAKAITRQGSHYPTWFAERMAKGLPKGAVLVGEMEVYQKNMGVYTLLDRKTGNGVLNSVASGADASEFDSYKFSYVAWDMLTESEFKAGKSTRKYGNRFLNLQSLLQNAPSHLALVDHWEVSSVAEANAIHLQHTKDGKEGTVWKTPEGEWRDTSSGTKDAVKNKLVFEAEFEVTGWYEGEGKAAGMLGGLTVATSCRKLTNNVGSGFSDKQRKEIWDAIQKGDTPMGWIVTLEANDILSAKGKETLSLSLPIFIERRFDKKEADSLERVMEQLEAAKQGK